MFKLQVSNQCLTIHQFTPSTLSWIQTSDLTEADLDLLTLDDFDLFAEVFVELGEVGHHGDQVRRVTHRHVLSCHHGLDPKLPLCQVKRLQHTQVIVTSTGNCHKFRSMSQAQVSVTTTGHQYRSMSQQDIATITCQCQS